MSKRYEAVRQEAGLKWMVWGFSEKRSLATGSQQDAERIAASLNAAPTLLQVCKWIHGWLASLPAPSSERDAAISMLAAAIQDATGDVKQ